MTKNSELYTRKFFFTSKLTLALVLLFAVVRTVLLPDRLEKTLASASAPGGDRVSVNETADLSDLQYADYAEIVEKNPFGISSQTAGANKWASFQPVVSEELGLALFGTVSGSPEIARAIIKNLKTGVFDLYRIGQTVEGVRIEDIGTDEVILSRNGERKILRLSMAQSNNKTPSPITVDEMSNAAETDLAHTDVLTRIGYVEAILNKAVIEPHIVDGQVEGLRITALENIKEAKELGLKNGDVIRTVNGHRLTSKQKAHQIFKKTSSQKAINLELLRDGETKNLSFDLR